MKNIFVFMLIVCMSLGCKKESKKDERLVGTWRLKSSVEGSKSYTFDSSFLIATFNVDNSLKMTSYSGESKTTRYNIDGNNLYLNSKASVLGFDIDSSTFTIAGSEVTFHKLRNGITSDFVFKK